MNYEPTNWQTGDLITAGKLNNIEQGIVNASVKVITCTMSGNPETGDRSISNMNLVCDALDEISADHSKALNYAVLVENLLDVELSVPVFYTPTIYADDGEYATGFVGASPSSFFLFARKRIIGDETYSIGSGNYAFGREDLSADGTLTGQFGW